MFCRTGRCVSGLLGNRGVTVEADLAGTTLVPRPVAARPGAVSRAVSYTITNLAAKEATVETLAALWQGHWAIENRRHYVRDVT